MADDIFPKTCSLCWDFHSDMRYFFNMPLKALDHLQDELLRAGAAFAAFLANNAFLAGFAGAGAALGAAFLKRAWICILNY